MDFGNFKMIREEEFRELMPHLSSREFFKTTSHEVAGRTWERIPTEVYERARKKADDYKAKMKKLAECTELNNKGIDAEKRGDIEEAISIYEENIDGDCYPAQHSFDRLAILYRKTKRYDDEIRVLKKACKVFKKSSREKYANRLEKAKFLKTKRKK